jgi:putative ABC transport system ATP-binding protein
MAVEETKQLIIEAHNISKTYYTGNVEVPALRGVSLQVRKGEMLAIMGPSGCGKTTLLNCLSGLDIFEKGTVSINGEDITRLADNEKTDFRARKMGFVFQTYNLLPVLNAVENIELPLIVSGVRPAQARKQAIASLKRVNLSQYATHRPGQLSGGQRQRVTLARSVVNNPAIIWADEPTGALDSQTAGEIMDLLCDLNKTESQTQVIVTHAPEVAALCDRIIYMADGLIEREEIAEQVT